MEQAHSPLQVGLTSNTRLRVVVPAAGAARFLERCIGALVTALDGLDGEITIVDEGGNGDLTGFDRLKPQVVVVAGTGLRRAGATRNRGARGFDGDIVAFVDSDVVVGAEALRALIEPIRAGRADATVGRYGTAVAGLGFAQAYKQLYIAHVYGRDPGYLKDEFWSALGAVRARDLAAVGGFSEDFNGASGEDTELGQRLSAAGCRVLAVPGAEGVHLKALSVAGLFRNDLRKGVVSAALVLRSGRRLSDFRHSRARDMAAVVCSWLVALSASASAFCLLPVFSTAPPTALFQLLVPLSLASLCGWGLARSELYTAFAGQPPGFRLRALPVMFGLDVVRGVCVVAGALQALAGSGPSPAALNAQSGGSR